jgi:hypothetical protein
MTEPEPPRAGDDTPPGADANQDSEDTRLANGARLTGTVAGMIVEQLRQTARLLPRPGLRDPQRPDLMPLPELLGQLAADLRELRPRGRLAAALRQLANTIERTKPQ